MDQSYSSLHSATCLPKDCNMFRHREKAADPERCHLSRSQVWRLAARRRSNSISMCILPSIPEYPGFQDIKRNYSKGSSLVLQDLGRIRDKSPARARAVGQTRNPGHSMDAFAKGHCKSKSNFCDKTLQEYFNERLMELRNYETKKSNGRMKGYANENQKRNFTSRALRRRSSCSAIIQSNHMKLTEESHDSADQSATGCAEDQGVAPNIQDCCRRTYLECLAMSINAPLAMLVQRK
ncbi:Ferrochelatase [Varanus komodoensis]|nr:Ferrochelatase [Varanus komodoensis]